jgi:hypothetical protein
MSDRAVPEAVSCAVGVLHGVLCMEVSSCPPVPVNQYMLTNDERHTVDMLTHPPVSIAILASTGLRIPFLGSGDLIIIGCRT